MRRKGRAQRNPEVQPGDPNWLAREIYNGRASIRRVPAKVLLAWSRDADHPLQDRALRERQRRERTADHVRIRYLMMKDRLRGLSAREHEELFRHWGLPTPVFDVDDFRDLEDWDDRGARRWTETVVLPPLRSPWRVLLMIGSPFEIVMAAVKHEVQALLGVDDLESGLIAWSTRLSRKGSLTPDELRLYIGLGALEAVLHQERRHKRSPYSYRAPTPEELLAAWEEVWRALHVEEDE